MDLANLFGSRFVRGFRSNCFDREVYKTLEDSVDRWSFLYSFTIISCLAFISTANVYFFRAFECTPLVTQLAQINILGYIHAYCWSKGTTAIQINESMPISSEEWDKAAEVGKISFYQWVPFCLALQAILFLLPHILWDTLASRAFGDDINAILENAAQCIGLMDSIERQAKIKSCTSKIIYLAKSQSDERTSRLAAVQRWGSSRIPFGRVLCCGKRMGNWITFSYICSKFLYIVNLIGQLQIVKHFLSHGRRTDALQSGSLYQFTMSLFSSLWQADEWDGGGSVFFPRKTYCMVDFKHLGVNQNRYLSVCALPVNIYTEKMYVFLWIWLWFVLGLTVISLTRWLISTMLARGQEHFVYSMVKYRGDFEKHELIFNKFFIKQFLRSDGVFILKMIKNNSGSLVAQEICLEAWEQCKSEFIKFVNKPSLQPSTIPKDSYC